MKDIASARDASASSAARVLGCIDESFVFDGVQRYKHAPGEPVPFDGVLEMRGWATIGEPPHTAARFDVVAGGRHATVVAHRLPRPDVAAHLGSADAADCGFIFRIDPEGLALAAGRHGVRVLLDGSNEAFAFDILTERSPRNRDEAHRRFEIGDLGVTGEREDGPGDGSIERGTIAIVRGTLRDREAAGIPHDVRCVVNRSVPCRVLIERLEDDGTMHLLACVPTDALPLGRATFRFLTRGAPEDAYERSDRFAFDVTPICLYEPCEPYRRAAATGTIAWPDGAGETLRAKRGTIARVDGWIRSGNDLCATGSAYVVFDGGQQFAMSMGAKRPDAVAAAGSPYVLFTGFAGSIDTSAFEPGTYRARLYAVSHDAVTLFSCDAALTLIVDA